MAGLGEQVRHAAAEFFGGGPVGTGVLAVLCGAQRRADGQLLHAHRAAQGFFAQGAREVKIHGQYVPVRAEVAVVDNLSAHADYAETLQWLEEFAGAPRQTFVTHGEPAAADALRRRIGETLGWNCRVPDYRESVELA